MGKLEQESRIRTKRNELRKIILQTVKVAGILSVAGMAPNVIGAMVKLGIIPSSRQNAVIKRASDRMVKAGLLVWHGGKLRLTGKGETALRALALQDYKITRPRRWDQKWRILIFDIPEHRKGLREKMRRTLDQIGFVRLQDSVWVYPYDCEDLMALLKADFHVGDDVLYIIADTIERDASLRRYFKLK